MPEILAATLPLILAAVLIGSGVAKLVRPDSVAGWRELGVPASLARPLLVRAHPWGEIALGVAVAVLGGVLGVLAAVVAVALMAAYTVLVARVVRTADDASCACFGARVPVTRMTLLRNAWLTALAVATGAVVWAAPLWGGAVAVAVLVPGAVAAAGVAAVTVAVILWHPAIAMADASGTAVGADTAVATDTAVAADGEPEDYVRTRTPAVPVTQADGTVRNLRDLAARKPILLLAVSPTCGACTPVIDAVAEYRRLLPEVDVRLLLRATPEHSPLTDHDEPQSLHDVNGYVQGSISDWPTPSAVLLGIDGMLAGGPESGSAAISSFVDDIYESLHGQHPSELDRVAVDS